MTSLTSNDATDRTHRWAPLLLLCGGVVALVASVRLGLGDVTRPGPGAWPLVASVGVVLTSAWLVVTGVETPEETDRSDLAHVGLAVASTAGFVVLLPLIGMPVPAALMITAWMRLFGETWRLSILTAVLGTVALQVVFVDLLGVPLPVGPLAPGGW